MDILVIHYIGQEIVGYESPRRAMGIHRMVFVVFRQQGEWQRFDAPGWRQNFFTGEFAELYWPDMPAAALYFALQREPNHLGTRR